MRKILDLSGGRQLDEAMPTILQHDTMFHHSLNDNEALSSHRSMHPYDGTARIML